LSRTAGRLAALLAILLPLRVSAQARADLRIRDGRSEWAVATSAERGYATVPVSELVRLGWRVAAGPGEVDLVGPEGVQVEVRADTPFFRWNGEVLQLADPPYRDGSELRVPLQVLTELLPRRLPELYSFDEPAMRLTYGGGPGPRVASPAGGDGATPVQRGDGVRVVVIDAGHGGDDPGSVSRSGIQEKNVALGVALALAHALDSVPNLEVHLLRDDDTFIPLWDRGAMATKLKGERPGVFISVHANSFNSPARGFETYFLSDARTEHERRVAEVENAPLAEEQGVQKGGDLDLILRELKNLDTQHWSALLAEMIQTDVAKVHPGPNRGVKQAPLAVITNALMPAVLVEVGYLSHPEEARLLARSDFQKKAGEAIAQAVVEFFERYPPGTGGVTGAGR
jgi:N-acetylmuramoyl-L-alanine amidase